MIRKQQLIRRSTVTFMLTAALILTACAQQSGSPDAPGSGDEPVSSDAGPGTSAAPSAPGTPSSSAAAIDADLTIVLTEAPGATPHTFRLIATKSVAGSASTVTDPAAAIAVLERYGEKAFFSLPDPNQACTEIYGGPQVAQVTGTFNGRSVNASFARTNGCDISRWDSMAPLFGALAGGTGAI